MKQAFIDDGYTLTAVVEETDDYPLVEYTFRPPLHTEVTQFLHEVQQLNAAGRTAEAAKLGCTFVANKLHSWNLPRDPVVESVRRLHPDLFAELYGVMLGSRRPKLVDAEAQLPEDAAKNSTAG